MIPGIAKERDRFRRWLWMGIAGAISVCACLGAVMFANRDNPSAVPTIRVEEIETAVASNASPTPPASAQSVQLTLQPYLQGTMLIVEGETDLPNRTLLLYEVSEVSAEPRVVIGTAPVLDGRYTRQVDLTGWHAGMISIWVGFQTQLGNHEAQSEDVIERFGEMGEFLYGENVTETGGLKRVEVMQMLEFLPP